MAAGAEGGAFVRFPQALKDLTADTFAGFLDRSDTHIEAALRIKVRVLRAQSQTTLGDLVDASPLSWDH